MIKIIINYMEIENNILFGILLIILGILLLVWHNLLIYIVALCLIGYGILKLSENE